jgi:DUF2075 family protein
MKKPIIKEISYDATTVRKLDQLPTNDRQRELLLDFPTVYIINNRESKQARRYTVYVGETNNIVQRTQQHLIDDPKQREDWQALADAKNAKMFVIAHDHFNKSLTLDIEDRLMLYLSGSNPVRNLNNRRRNDQTNYYPKEEMAPIFSAIWAGLHHKLPSLFPTEKIVQESAVFKASPFHALRPEQITAKQQIIARVREALANNERGQLIFVEGNAGSGKTVLLSNLFYDIANGNFESPDDIDEDDASTPQRDLSAALLVNHNEQLKVYEEIAAKLNLNVDGRKVVDKPTPFINASNPDQPLDVVLVDEGHLLLTRGKQSYTGKNQLHDIMARARVTILVFDRRQILKTEEYWEDNELRTLEQKACATGNMIVLHNQLRIAASQSTIDWLENFVYGRRLSPLALNRHHRDAQDYEIRVFDSPRELQTAITAHVGTDETNAHGLSRMLATFDWAYGPKPNEERDDHLWHVTIGDWELPWNQQHKVPKGESKLAWAEQSQTIREVGSTYTIQGFDLNYSAVIIGPSVKYRHGQIVFDPAGSKNKGAIQRRTLKDGSKVYLSDELLQNELNVLLTRGVHGLYLYAVDSALQAHLKECLRPQD